jgi:hypothetical protein
MTGGRLVDAEPAREIREQAHRGEFGRPDRKPAHRQRKHDEAGMRVRSLRCGHGKTPAAIRCDNAIAYFAPQRSIYPIEG